jgi:electron-transferring-flavoprotein dehydrogenase
MDKFDLRSAAENPQTYGIGLKEVWEIPEDNKHFKPGLVQHTLGWPLQTGVFDKTFGGTFLYHMEPNLILVGMVVGLDYENPYINPYEEFQRWKTHPEIAKFFEGGSPISYGARALNEGGFHSIPKLTFPGGALIGCSAGFLNSVKIKGSHTAMKSGMVAGEAVFDHLHAKAEAGLTPVSETFEIEKDEVFDEVTAYQTGMENSWVWEELKVDRNCHQAFHYGVGPGLAYTGALGNLRLLGKEPWTLKAPHKDAEKTKPAADYKPIDYPKPDGVLTFDLLSNLQLSGTNHEDQPSHLRLKEDKQDVPHMASFPKFGAPETRFCPAKVYEYTDGSEADGVPQLVINAQNCLHCKTCSIKMPEEYIDWTVPEGGGGPAYEVM